MDYQKVALEVSKLVEEKNAAYGNAVKKTAAIMRVLFPEGIDTREYERIFLIVRIIDKICREATNENEENYRDICGYSLRQLAAYDNARHPKEECCYSHEHYDDSDNVSNRPDVTGHSGRVSVSHGKCNCSSFIYL